MSNSSKNGTLIRRLGFGSSTLFISMTHHTKGEPWKYLMRAVTPRVLKMNTSPPPSLKVTIYED